MSDIDEKVPRGFAGLTALASTISAAPTIGLPPASSARPSDPEPAEARSHQGRRSTGPGFWTGSRKTWALVIAGICVLAYLSARPQSSSYVPPYTGGSTTSALPRATPLRSSESMKIPSVGQGLTFSVAEIRYCLAEVIRLDHIETTADLKREVHIRNLNLRINDYNSRCTRYRHRVSDMTIAKSDVEAMRAALRSEAAEQMLAWR